MSIEILKKMRYPGRLIIIGKDPKDLHYIVIYAVTGRSPGSQARLIEVESTSRQTTALVKPVPDSENAFKETNLELLVYSALIVNQGVVVGNGRQTEDIFRHFKPKKPAVATLTESLIKWEYEPDTPHFTPRISGCITPAGSAALAIVKKAPASGTARIYFDLPLLPGKGYLISTYSGQEVTPLPSFHGEPVVVEMERMLSPDKAAEIIYNSLAPPTPDDPDYRVACVSLFVPVNDFSDHQLVVINRHEL
jgi:IMP cyclohydrolase